VSDFTDWTQEEMARRVSAATIAATGSLLVKANNAFSRDYNNITFSNFEASLTHDNLISGTIASHDTSATGAQLNTLTDNSIANTLHRHSELVASDGDPDPAVTVDAAGNVGVGKSPSSKLDVNGLINTSGVDGGFRIAPRDDTGTSYIWYNQTGDDISLYNGVNVFTVLNSGNILLPLDDQLLQFGAAQDYSIQWDGDDAVHTISAGNFVFMGGNTGYGVSDPDAKIEIFDTATQLKLSYDATNYTTFVVGAAGNLSITPSGTTITNVTATIIVQNTGQAALRLYDATANEYTDLIQNASDGSFDIARLGTGGVDFSIKNNGDTIIGQQGNVGCGVSDPDTKLDVDGAISMIEKSINPDNPDEGKTVIWMSDGTEAGDDGDILMASTVDGVTKHEIIYDYSEVEAEKWDVFDPGGVGPNNKGYYGVAFDGRYIYFAPYKNTVTSYSGRVLRYDTQKHFDAYLSWKMYDAKNIGTNTTGFSDVIFDGRYMYFIPYLNSSGWHGEFLRYDTQADFETAASWTAYDPGGAAVGTDPDGYWGGAFDGRYLYFAPYYNGSAYHGEVLRYDTQASFTTAGSWTVYDASSVGSNSTGFSGAIFDGRYIYFVPYYNGSYHGEVLRYDTQGDFATAGNWSAYDPGGAAVGTDPDGYHGAVFDGRYIYFSPHHNGTGYHGEVLRYDTQATFATAGSWATYDASGVGDHSIGYHGVEFDGRYLYFVPEYTAVNDIGEVLRYDTQASFSTASSWVTYNPKDIGPNPNGYAGAVFNGRYVFFAPYYDGSVYNGEVLRYDIKGDFEINSSWSSYDSNQLDSAIVNSSPDGYRGIVADHRYIYFIPWLNDVGWHTEFLQYDTKDDFNDVNSWRSYIVGGTAGFDGGAFDGRYIYFSPLQNASGYHGAVKRYDTQGDFETSGSWAEYDPGANGVGTDPDGYAGACFDGRYIYFSPFNNGTAAHGEVLRYDTQATFATTGSWTTYDASGIGTDTTGYHGVIFDGRYIYFAPLTNTSGQHGEVLRYDTQGDFSTAGNWSSYDISSIGSNTKGFFNLIFDGRYIYFSPFNNGVSYHGEVVRYDTQATFASAGSWTAYDVTNVCPGAKGYTGGGFDGRYIHFVPFYDNSVYHGKTLKYDTQGSFTNASSWSVYNIEGMSDSTIGFLGGLYKDNYMYYSPYYTGSHYHGNVVRYNTQTVDNVPIRFGDTSNYSEFEYDGTLRFNGNATIWDDLRVSALTTKLPASGQPSFSQFADDGASSTGVYTYFFSDSTEQSVFFTIQMPHGYKFGTNLYPHVHWAPQSTDTGQVDWFLEYTIANLDGLFGNTNTVTMSDNGSGTINAHQMTEEAIIDGSNLTLSHMLICRLYRNGGQGNDDFSGNAAFLEFDIHFEQDTIGSRREYIK
jgi:hypothetical protein